MLKIKIVKSHIWELTEEDQEEFRTIAYKTYGYDNAWDKPFLEFLSTLTPMLIKEILDRIGTLSYEEIMTAGGHEEDGDI